MLRLLLTLANPSANLLPIDLGGAEVAQIWVLTLVCLFTMATITS